MELITTDSNIFTATNIYLLLYTYIEEKEKEVNIYTCDSKTKEELSEKYSQEIQKYFGGKNISYISDPTKFSGSHDPVISSERVQKGAIFKGSEIYKELASDPFFVSSGINDIAWGYAERVVNNNRSTILFLYGPSATGKSHLAAKIAISLHESGKNIHVSSGDSFISEVFDCFKNNIDFLELNKNINCFVIDDIQMLNKSHLVSILDYLFSIMSHIANVKGKLVVTCDQHPAALKMFPDRIITRLMSDYIAEIKLPDENIKRQFVEHSFRKMNITFASEQDESDIKKFIILNSPQLRVARGLLGLCDMINSQIPILTFSDFIARVPKQITPSNSKLWQLRELLLNFFGEIDGKKDKNRQRRKTIKTDSVCYYLLQGVIERKALQKDLNIASTHHRYFLERGKQVFESISDEGIKMQIKVILQR